MLETETLETFRPDHLAWPLPKDLSVIPKEDLYDFLKERKRRILLSEADPLMHGYVPKIWDVVDRNIAELKKLYPRGVIKIVIFGGNRSSKTRKASNYVNRDCAMREGRRWWCCDSTESQARSNQMRLIHEQLPVEWRNLQRDSVVSMNYTLADGFSKNLIVYPNRSEVGFKFYSMDISNLPGPELDGIWADELIPLQWVETLVYRLVNRNGIFLITFTPELGWNETFQYFYEGAQVLEETEAPLLPRYDEDGTQVGYKLMPRVMQCVDPTARIIFFHTSDNPFGNYPSLVQQLKGKGEEEISIRAYGLCTKSHTLAFPLFNKNVHVVTECDLKEILKNNPKAERYHLVDPCDGRNWFMIWVVCPSPDKWIIYREWPPAHYGPWATSGADADGVKGPAQNSLGFSLERYMEEILNEEEGEHIVARYIDSRYATAPRIGQESVTSLIEQLCEVGMDFHPMVAGKGRIIGMDRNDGSVDLINSALFWDTTVEPGKWSKDLGRLNEPKLQVLDTCANVIYSLSHWSGKGPDAGRGACKDPVDCIRGLFLSMVNYTGGEAYKWQGGGIPRR